MDDPKVLNNAKQLTIVLRPNGLEFLGGGSGAFTPPEMMMAAGMLMRLANKLLDVQEQAQMEGADLARRLDLKH